MLFSDTYKTIRTPSQGVFRDRGSKFIGCAYPVDSESQVKDILAAVKTAYPKARHYCWALRISPDRSIFRINDDGEPSGTAGRPILNTLLSLDITNTLVVVVRYFGGTLLGVPGLINAYKTAGTEALAAADVIEKTINDIYLLSFNYLQLNEVMKLVKDHNLSIRQQHFDNNCTLELEIPQAQLNRIISKFEQLQVACSYLTTI